MTLRAIRPITLAVLSVLLVACSTSDPAETPRAIEPTRSTGPAQAYTTDDEASGDRTLHHFGFSAAMQARLYDGAFTLEEVISNGDFGVGTFDKLNGEMVILDGTVYRANADGSATVVEDLSETTPAATVTRFRADLTEEVDGMDEQDLRAWVVENLNTDRHMYALKITGTFDQVTSRSQEKLTSRPYPSFQEIVDRMIYHEIEGVQGTLVGFHMPPYSDGFNYPGLHTHFVSQSGSGLGGCAPGFAIRSGTIQVMKLTAFTVQVPDTPEFAQADLSGNPS